VFTVDGGNTSLWAYNMKPPTRPRSYHSILEFGMPGTWIPFAIGAKLGGPTARSLRHRRRSRGLQRHGAADRRARGRRHHRDLFAEGSWTRKSSTSASWPARRSGPPRARSAETSSPRGWAVTASTWIASWTSTARCGAREHDGPSLVCLRTDHDANLAVPAEMTSRFFEVYFGSGKPATV